MKKIKLENQNKTEYGKFASMMFAAGMEKEWDTERFNFEVYGIILIENKNAWNLLKILMDFNNIKYTKI